MKTSESKNLSAARAEAIQYSLKGAATSLYQVGADSFIISCCPVERGVLIGTWLNGNSVPSNPLCGGDSVILPGSRYDVHETEKTPAQKAWETRRANAGLKAEPDKTPSAHLFNAREFKVVCLREVPLPDDLALCHVPSKAADFWNHIIATSPTHKPDVESFYILILNTRRKVTGYHLVSNGTLDTILVHPREVFRPAIVANAAAIILMHNHPSGESSALEPCDKNAVAHATLYTIAQWARERVK
jgi:hypothetical protein